MSELTKEEIEIIKRSFYSPDYYEGIKYNLTIEDNIACATFYSFVDLLGNTNFYKWFDKEGKLKDYIDFGNLSFQDDTELTNLIIKVDKDITNGKKLEYDGRFGLGITCKDEKPLLYDVEHLLSIIDIDEDMKSEARLSSLGLLKKELEENLAKVNELINKGLNSYPEHSTIEAEGLADDEIAEMQKYDRKS